MGQYTNIETANNPTGVHHKNRTARWANTAPYGQRIKPNCIIDKYL